MTDDTQAQDLTRSLAAAATELRADALPEAVRQLARQCVLDYLGVGLSGAGDPLVAILLEEMAAEIRVGPGERHRP